MYHFTGISRFVNTENSEFGQYKYMVRCIPERELPGVIMLVLPDEYKLNLNTKAVHTILSHTTCNMAFYKSVAIGLYSSNQINRTFVLYEYERQALTLATNTG